MFGVSPVCRKMLLKYGCIIQIRKLLVYLRNLGYFIYVNCAILLKYVKCLGGWIMEYVEHLNIDKLDEKEIKEGLKLCFSSKMNLKVQFKYESNSYFRL